MNQKSVTLSVHAVLLAAGLYTACADASESATDVVEQIVVVANKDRRSLREVAANVTVVSRSELSDQLASSINDVFRYLPGVDYEAAGTRFGTEGINIRGIGGNRVAIVVDGVPLSDHFEVGSFSNATRNFVDAGLIQSVEVLHGPASTLYGSSAIGGVVAVATPEPFELSNGPGSGGEIAGAWHGADDSAHAQAMIAAGDRRLGVLAGLSWHEGEQLDSAAATDTADTRHTQSDTALLKLMGDNRFGHGWRAEYIQQRAHTKSDLNSLLGQGRYRTTTALEGNDESEFELAIAAYEFGSPDSWFSNGTLRGFHEQSHIEQATLDERAAAATPVSIDRFFSFSQQIDGVDLNLWRDHSGTTAEHRFGAGVEFRRRRTEEFRDGLSTNLQNGVQSKELLGEVFPLRDFPLSTSREISAYLEDSIRFADWTVIAALRAERFELSPDQDAMYFEDYPFAEPVSIDDAELSPKLGLIYHTASGSDFYLQYAHGFRAPPYADANIGLEVPLFNYRAIPNPSLKSESSNGFELGMRSMQGGTSLRIALFHTRYDDFIESKVQLGTDPVSGRILFQSQNLRAAQIQGVEAGFERQFGGAWQAFSIDATAYYARGENRQTGAALNSVGPPQAVLGIGWRSADGDRALRLAGTFTDDWSDRDESGGELFKPAGHAVFDLMLTQSVGTRVRLHAALRNLTDCSYWNWSDVRGLAPDDPLLPYLAQAGRNVSLGLNMSW